ncbi:MAG: hypothetical protein ABIS68_01245 [Casimicrobiaceae bacterium]
MSGDAPSAPPAPPSAVEYSSSILQEALSELARQAKDARVETKM